LPLTALFLTERFGVPIDNIDVDAAAVQAAVAVGAALASTGGRSTSTTS